MYLVSTIEPIISKDVALEILQIFGNLSIHVY